MDNQPPPDAPRPRLCHIIKRQDFSGYGFNLHAEKARPGQFIGKVDENSPAEVAGLKEGDRIVEVNGVNISQENHKQVVQRIKAVPNETKLLVVDKTADEYYKKLNMLVKGSLPNVWVRSSEDDRPEVTGNTRPEVNGNNLEEDTMVAPVVVDNEDTSDGGHRLKTSSSRSSSSSVEKVRRNKFQWTLFQSH